MEIGTIVTMPLAQYHAPFPEESLIKYVISDLPVPCILADEIEVIIC